MDFSIFKFILQYQWPQPSIYFTETLEIILYHKLFYFLKRLKKSSVCYIKYLHYLHISKVVVCGRCVCVDMFVYYINRYLPGRFYTDKSVVTIPLDFQRTPQVILLHISWLRTKEKVYFKELSMHMPHLKYAPKRKPPGPLILTTGSRQYCWLKVSCF